MPISYVLRSLVLPRPADHTYLDMGYLWKESHWPSYHGDGKQFWYIGSALHLLTTLPGV
jgi:hypothetical protein